MKDRRPGSAARYVAAVLAAATALASQGCAGYSLAGRGSFLPDYIRTIGVPIFVNNTQAFGIEEQLTQKVRAEFIGRGKYKVTPESAGADAVLTCTLSSVQVQPAGFGADTQQASRYTIILTASVEFTDARDGKALWNNPALVYRDEFEVLDVTSTNSGSLVDVSAFFGQSSNAIERLGTDFAKSVVSSILEAF